MLRAAAGASRLTRIDTPMKLTRTEHAHVPAHARGTDPGNPTVLRLDDREGGCGATLLEPVEFVAEDFWVPVLRIDPHAGGTGPCDQARAALHALRRAGFEARLAHGALRVDVRHDQAGDARAAALELCAARLRWRAIWLIPHPAPPAEPGGWMRWDVREASAPRRCATWAATDRGWCYREGHETAIAFYLDCGPDHQRTGCRCGSATRSQEPGRQFRAGQTPVVTVSIVVHPDPPSASLDPCPAGESCRRVQPGTVLAVRVRPWPGDSETSWHRSAEDARAWLQAALNGTPGTECAP